MKNDFLKEISIEELEDRNEFTAATDDASCDITIEIDICFPQPSWPELLSPCPLPVRNHQTPVCRTHLRIYDLDQTPPIPHSLRAWI